MPDLDAWISAARSSQDRFAALVLPLDAEQVQHPSYAEDWSVAQVASHLGSQAEIFGLALDAGLAGTAAPGMEQFQPLWDTWNGRSAQLQATESVKANEALVSRIEGLSEADRARFKVSLFGREVDLAGLLALRLGEHALHTWDIAVALDSTAVLSADAVDLLIDVLPSTAARAGRAAAEPRTLAVETAAPERRFTLTTGPDVVLTPDSGTGPVDLVLPAEELVRLVYGRLDEEATSAELPGHEVVPELRQVFPGF
ncbi:maleylpyruvate isomerase family mycothiol-dependent enzyme [Streptacidiphilus cavernicola]|uniref:Maleylpyruvate isomerase family mycothiol-dependent enzyme n=1 Tax=Streptacidiphilus cavernicola TaxID=3342716 RepID=A0ABV6VNY9_9ACTN